MMINFEMFIENKIRDFIENNLQHCIEYDRPNVNERDYLCEQMLKFVNDDLQHNNLICDIRFEIFDCKQLKHYYDIYNDDDCYCYKMIVEYFDCETKMHNCEMFMHFIDCDDNEIYNTTYSNKFIVEML